MSEAAIFSDETAETKSSLTEPMTDDEDVASRITADAMNGVGEAKISRPAAIVLTKIFEQIDSIEPHPSLKELGAFGLIE